MQFGSFELDDDRFELTRDGLAVALRPKVFDLLVVLVRERARVVRRDEIFERLWSTTAVGFGSLAGLVNELRTALGESGRGPSSIRTVHARGYQFVAPVRILASETESMTFVAGDASGSTQVGPREPGVDLGRLRERLGAAVDEVSRAGARALVIPIPGERERSIWLAAAASVAIDAGFSPRFAAATRVRIADGRCKGGFASGAEGSGGDESTEAVHGRARVPIALCLEVRDLDGWGRAGGIRRLLDLLGRAPVLVLAALATSAGDPIVSELGTRDARIEVVADGQAVPIPDDLGREDAGFLGAEALARTLRMLARADRTAFEAALRSLGFEVARVEPIRTLRRVAPAPVGSTGALDMEAI